MVVFTPQCKLQLTVNVLPAPLHFDIDIDIEKWKTASVQLFFSSAQNK